MKRGPCKVNCAYMSHDFQWNAANSYHIKFTWDPHSVTLQIDDNGPTAPEPSGAVTSKWTCPILPNYRYLYIGHDVSPYNPIKNATYSNLRVTELPDPCLEHGTNGAHDCGEQELDCGGECPTCPRPDAEPSAGRSFGSRRRGRRRNRRGEPGVRRSRCAG